MTYQSHILKILIIRFSSIGDIVLTTPVVRCLKQQLPNVELHYLTKPAFKDILSNNPYIYKVWTLQASISDTVNELERQNFDLIIDLHNNLRTRMIKLRLNVPARSFNKLNLKKLLLVKLKVNLLPDRHIVERYLDTVRNLGVKDDGKGLDYFFSEDYHLSSLLPDSHQNYVGLVIGAQHYTKRLPVEKLIAICEKINEPIVLLGGKEDAERGVLIQTALDRRIFNACGKFSLDESAFLVKKASRIITHDTGLMHIAAAFNKPITSVWGNTIPEFGMYPYRTDEHRVAEVQGLKCRPCSKIGYKECPWGHFKCMNDQDSGFIAGNY